MIVPANVAYSTLAPGSVFSYQGDFFIASTSTSAVRLDTGLVNTAFTGAEQVLPFPNASLNLG